MVGDQAGEKSVTTVCFHGIGDLLTEREPGERRYWVARSTFERVLDAVAARTDLAITFDDGNESDLTVALPALLERGLTAKFFVLAGRIGQVGSLDEAGIRTLRDHGMSIGSHGLHHRRWQGLTSEGMREELVEARRRLVEVVEQDVNEAAVPLGSYDRSALVALRRFGYRRVYTSDRRSARAGRWLQPRFSVRSTDTAESFLREIDRVLPLADRSVRRLRAVVKTLR